MVANGDAEQVTPCNNRIRGIVKARIWRFMQKSLYNSQAARRLKPIKPKDGAILLHQVDEMLDGSSVPSLQTDSGSPIEDEDMYDVYQDPDSEILDKQSFDGEPEIMEEYDEPYYDLFDDIGELDDMWWCEESLPQHDARNVDFEGHERFSDLENTFGSHERNQQLSFLSSSDSTQSHISEILYGSPRTEQPSTAFSDDDMLSPIGNATDNYEAHCSLPHNPPSDASTSPFDEDLLFTDEPFISHSALKVLTDEEEDLSMQQRQTADMCPEEEPKDENENETKGDCNDESDDEMMSI